MKNETRRKIRRLLVVILIFICLVLCIYTPLKFTGTLDKITNIEDVKNLILSCGIYGYIIFFVIQFLQATFIPIPAIVTTVAGSLVFGPLVSALIGLSAILVASCFSFFMGRKLGRKLIGWIIGNDEAEKWEEKLLRGKYVFFLMMLFPFFPDDVLCLVAGTTNMTFRFFIITNLISRPITVFVSSYFGSGSIIPFSGWGIPIWITLAVVAIVLFYVIFKYQPKIEAFIARQSDKMEQKEKRLKQVKAKKASKENIVDTKQE